MIIEKNGMLEVPEGGLCLTGLVFILAEEKILEIS